MALGLESDITLAQAFFTMDEELLRIWIAVVKLRLFILQDKLTIDQVLDNRIAEHLHSEGRVQVLLRGETSFRTKKTPAVWRGGVSVFGAAWGGD